jgi:hypothetical protein
MKNFPVRVKKEDVEDIIMGNVELETIELERLRTSLIQLISIRDLRIDVLKYSTDIAKNIKMMFSKDYLCQKQDKKIFFSTPLTWWDHFKMRYRNNWLMKKWLWKHPIRYGKHVYDVSKCVVFPDKLIPHGLEYKDRFMIYQTINKGEK